MKDVWEKKIAAALIEKGVSADDANTLMNGVIYDAVEDEKWDARWTGYYEGVDFERMKEI